MLKQHLHQKLLQKLSPQQIQLIKLLEIPTLQLEQRIKKEIEENPVLEEGNEDEYEQAEEQEYDEKAETGEESLGDFDQDQGNGKEEKERSDEDDFDLDDYMNDEDMPNYKLSTNNTSKDDDHKEIPFSMGMSFQEFLEEQLQMLALEEEEQVLARQIIGNIDDDGYLRRDVAAIVNDIAFSLNIFTSEEKLTGLLKRIQQFDPPGVGARSLQECLKIQIRRKARQYPDNPQIKLARQLVDKYFNEFTKKHYDKITTRLNISNEELKDAIDEILRLNPKPGSTFGSDNSNMQQIIPDFILEVNNQELQLSLNSKNSPELRINQTYRNMLQAYQETKKNQTRSEKEAMVFVKQKLDAAKWFIEAIKQRQNTLMLTMQAIIDYQHQYFVEGDERKLRPMILKDIAERTGLDISTISRVANSKYIQTHFGIFPLKYFFSEGMQKEDGEEVSTREIKSILQENIDAEDKYKPLTDEKLAKILQENGYKIARRTVAKYREQLNIPVARLRKAL